MNAFKNFFTALSGSWRTCKHQIASVLYPCYTLCWAATGSIWWAEPPHEWMNEWMGRWNAARGFLSDILTPIHTLSSAIIYRHNMSVVLCSLTHRKYAGGNWLPLVDYFSQSKFPPCFRHLYVAILQGHRRCMVCLCCSPLQGGSWWFRIGVQDFV